MLKMFKWDEEALPMPTDAMAAKLDRIVAVLTPPDVIRDAYAKARDTRRALERKLDAARSNFNVVARRYGNTINARGDDLTEAQALVESAERELAAATAKCAQMKEARQREFGAAVHSKLVEVGPLLAEVADMVSAVARALDDLHATAWRNGVEIPRVIAPAPVIRDGTIALQALANAVTRD